MFEELIEEYKKLPSDSRREKIIEELKLVVALLELLCDKKDIKYQDLTIDELLNSKDEDKFLEIAYSYITALKETLGSYVMETEKDS